MSRQTAVRKRRQVITFSANEFEKKQTAPPCWPHHFALVGYLVLNTLISNPDTRYKSKHSSYLLLGVTKNLLMIAHKLSKVPDKNYM